ncbi:MAG: hypothetical protein WAW52_12615 [Methanothrix sp.]
MEPRPKTARGDWEDIRTAMLYALDDYPEAKAALVTKLVESRSGRKELDVRDFNRQSGEWLELRGVILDALQPFPAARESVLAALKEVEA